MLTCFRFYKYFGKNRKVLAQPVYAGIGSIKEYVIDYLNYKISSLSAGESTEIVLLLL
jgi:hypothetical protein